MADRIKVLLHSNYSRMITGFGKNMRNILLALYQDPEFEIIEAANGVSYGRDAKTPWKSFGTGPSSQELINSLGQDQAKQRAAAYGFYEIDKIVAEVKPDVYLGIEDIWAFNGFVDTKPWWNETKKIIWTTLDSLPILPEAYTMANSCDKFLVWAGFSEEEMKKTGCKNVETLHGAVDYSNFKPLANREELRKRHGLQDSFVIGFVFKNQLRKSVPNLLDGFRLFKAKVPNAKLILHTDWADKEHGWDIMRYLKEKGLSADDVLCSYSCEACGEYSLGAYSGPELDCPHCGAAKKFKTKSSGHGLSELQLNEIYNLMDVYCHPFTSGGQELPIQEAKAAGLITLVTEYSCGTDSCYPEQGGLPLAWNEYREPHSQFIKASTCPESICSRLDQVYSMSPEEKVSLIQNGKEWVKKEFSVQSVVSRLKQIIKEVHAAPLVKAEQKNLPQENKRTEFDTLLDKERKDRILFVLPQSEEDVFVATSLLPNIKETYPDKDIYFATKPENKEFLLGNPFVYKILDFHPQMENLLMMEGQGENHEGYFEICFLPHVGTQKVLDYIHHGKDKIALNIYSPNYNVTH